MFSSSSMSLPKAFANLGEMQRLTEYGPQGLALLWQCQRAQINRIGKSGKTSGLMEIFDRYWSGHFGEGMSQRRYLPVRGFANSFRGDAHYATNEFGRLLCDRTSTLAANADKAEDCPSRDRIVTAIWRSLLTHHCRANPGAVVSWREQYLIFAVFPLSRS
jgi:hypothetical protein